MNRFEKLCWLEDTCSESFIKEVLPLELVRWMGEKDFDEFYDHLCRMWEIAKGPKELDELMGIGEDEEADEEELAYSLKSR